MSDQSVYSKVKIILIQSGWSIDENARENASGELREFIHPETGRTMAWIDALLAQGDIEDQK